MKIKRLYAANIREAMRQVREQLGPDAVILSNNRGSNGIEIVAAIDYDEKMVQQRLSSDAGATPESAKRQSDSPSALPPQNSHQTFADTIKSVAGMAGAAAKSIAGDSGSEQADGHSTDGGKPRIVWSQDPMLVDMKNEIKAIHGLLEQQLSSLAWGDLARRQPYRADLLERLMDFGLGPDLCLRLVNQALDESDFERSWRTALQTLASGLTVTDDDILTQGGVVALVGPTGVGKTTTVAKLAARYNLCHGPRQVALISTDSYRIGAFEQLRTFGMILDMPARLASNHDELQAAIKDFADKSLILIDTAGMSQRDLRLSQQFTLIGATPKVKRYLVLAANAQTHTLQEAASAFSQVPLAGCIFTKLDETSRLGGALSVAYDQGLPLAYVSDGQQVPEDLQVARGEALLELAESLMSERSGALEDETLALAFGKGVAHARI